jgi:hypothetical protein
VPPLSKGVITLLVKCSTNTLVNSYQVYTSVGWISVFKKRWISLWKKLNKDLVLCKFINYFLMSEQVIIFCKKKFVTSSHKFDNSRLSLGGFHKPIITFFLGQNHKMGEPFFSWRVKSRQSLQMPHCQEH